MLIGQLVFAFLYAFIRLLMDIALHYAYETVYKSIWYVYGKRSYGIMMANEVPGIVDPGPVYGPKEF